MSILREFVQFLLSRKKFWLLPIALAMFFVGGLMVLSSGSALAPFVYTMF